MRVSFYPNTATLSIISILLGLAIFIFPNILEYLLGAVLIILGVVGLLTKPRLF